MRRTLLIAAVLALMARMTVFADPGTEEAFISFAVFWACAAAYVVALVLA
jgi:hypothetical protein